MTIGILITLTLVLTVLFEVVTLAFRFGLGLRSAEVTRSTVGRLTRGYRLHHGYLVLPFGLLGGALWVFSGWLGGVAIAVGLSMLLSDLLHHFVFLKALTGSPEWDWKYPAADRVDV